MDGTPREPQTANDAKGEALVNARPEGVPHV